MDKQQNQIEEMEKTCSNCIHYEICSLWATTDLDEDEAYRYCFGHYRPKIPEGAMMLTEDNAEEIGNMVVESLQMQEAMKGLIKAWEKETAEKIMNGISSDILVITTIDYGSIEVVPMERLQEICNDIIDGE